MGIERQADAEVIAALRSKLRHESTQLAQKYRVLFSLRNLKGLEAHAAMLEGVPSLHPRFLNGTR